MAPATPRVAWAVVAMSLLHARTFRAAFMPEQAGLEGQLVAMALDTLTDSWPIAAEGWPVARAAGTFRGRAPTNRRSR